jgi:hypothetical protein
MKKISRFTGLVLALMGVMVLLSDLAKPRIAALHGSDIVSLTAVGMLFGVGFVGLIGGLRIPGE